MGNSAGKTIIASKAIGGQYVDLLVWTGDPEDPTKGTTIETELIDGFYIKENLFTMLPTIELRLADTSRNFMQYPLKIGDLLNVYMSPNAATRGEGTDEDYPPYIHASFVIETIVANPDASNNTYTYNVKGIYAAQAMINSIGKYPEDPPLGIGLYQQVASNEVIEKMCNQGGLGFTLECKPNDKSFWLCANETRAAFVERVIDHAWISDDDAPIAYTDVHGILHYTSIKTLCGNASGLTFADTSAEIDGYSPAKSNVVTFTEARTLNAGGPVLNRGGYVLKYSFYNPHNKKLIDWKEMKEHGKTGLANAVNIPGGDTAGVKDRNEGWREKEYKQNETYLANVSNKQPSERSNITIHKDGGQWFSEMHVHYNVAQKHNEMIRRSFFQNFVNIAVDVSRQGDLYAKKAYRPKLGHIIDVSFTSQHKVDPVHSGNYCIAEIVHKYTKGRPYTQSISLVNDGYYGS